MRNGGGLALIAALGAIALSGCAPKTGAHWKEVGSIDGEFIQFVEVDAASAKDGAVYRDAAAQLCHPGSCLQVGFFLPGDPVPPSGSRRDFFQTGGWASYAPAAIFMASSTGPGDFTKWDCQKAGEADAPSSALCGQGARPEYRAILDLATRTGWTLGCGLPATDNDTVLEKYLRGVSSVKRAELAAAYDQMKRETSKGPDDPANCANLRARIEADGRAARDLLAKGAADGQ